MSSILVQTRIPLEDYKRMKEMARALGLSEYALLQEAIIVYINEPEKSREKTMWLKFKKFLEEDLKGTAGI